ncbi:MAG: hypothetical protein RR064_06340 [Oscillospiraceae bacterium]
MRTTKLEDMNSIVLVRNKKFELNALRQEVIEEMKLLKCMVEQHGEKYAAYYLYYMEITGITKPYEKKAEKARPEEMSNTVLIRNKRFAMLIKRKACELNHLVYEIADTMDFLNIMEEIYGEEYVAKYLSYREITKNSKPCEDDEWFNGLKNKYDMEAVTEYIGAQEEWKVIEILFPTQQK